jgi:hypothetical protein
LSLYRPQEELARALARGLTLNEIEGLIDDRSKGKTGAERLNVAPASSNGNGNSHKVRVTPLSPSVPLATPTGVMEVSPRPLATATATRCAVHYFHPLSARDPDVRYVSVTPACSNGNDKVLVILEL